MEGGRREGGKREEREEGKRRTGREDREGGSLGRPREASSQGVREGE